MNLRLRTLTMMLAAAMALPAIASDLGAYAPSLTGIFVDAADGNRFFTRIGGTAEDRLTYQGLTAGQNYSLESRMVVVGSGQKSESVVTDFTAAAATGNILVQFPVPPNKTDFNIDYVSEHNLFQITGGKRQLILTVLGNSKDPNRTIQVHSIQRIKITSVADAQDGDRRIDGQGGKIIVKLRYENMVEGYAYTIWGQLLTPSGQAIGNFASIPRYAPAKKRGTLMLTFTVPAGYEGLSVIPSVGIYHHNRVTIAENGYLNWNPGAPNPVMIASDTNLNARNKTIEVGVPFGEEE